MDIFKPCQLPVPNLQAVNIGEQIKESVAPVIWDIMLKAGEIGQEMGFGVYAAGGIIRDVLLGIKALDLDLVVEGNGVALARAMGLFFGRPVRGHARFKTAQILFPGFHVDIATARSEFYPCPAALPLVKNATIENDLARRDFTINAMAVALNKERFGELLDFCGGRQDLAGRKLRVLHDYSFLDDPTRILRAVRFEQRYSFCLESRTKVFLNEAVQGKFIKLVSSARIWEELKLLLAEEKATAMLSRLEELGLWPALFPGIAYRGTLLKKIPAAYNLLRKKGFLELGAPWMICLIAVLHETTPEKASKIGKIYNLNKRQKDKIMKALSCREIIAGDWQDREVARARLLLAFPPEAFPLLVALLPGRQKKGQFCRFLDRIQKSRPSVGGAVIKSLGYRGAPVFRDALDALWQARFERNVETREEEIDFLKRYLQKRIASETANQDTT